MLLLIGFSSRMAKAASWAANGGSFPEDSRGDHLVHLLESVSEFVAVPEGLVITVDLDFNAERNSDKASALDFLMDAGTGLLGATDVVHELLQLVYAQLVELTVPAVR